MNRFEWGKGRVGGVAAQSAAGPYTPTHTQTHTHPHTHTRQMATYPLLPANDAKLL